jgi:hypothetical protein
MLQKTLTVLQKGCIVYLLPARSGNRRRKLEKYALICAVFGRKFAFHANNIEEAESKKWQWARYHGHSPKEYSVMDVTGEVPEYSDTHDEYMKYFK